MTSIYKRIPLDLQLPIIQYSFLFDLHNEFKSYYIYILYTNVLYKSTHDSVY